MLVALAAGASLVQAHPGDTQAQKRAEMNARNEYIRSLENTDLVHCAGKLAARGEVQKTVERREAILKTLRRKRGLSEHGMATITLLKLFKSGILNLLGFDSTSLSGETSDTTAHGSTTTWRILWRTT
jgi:hypothetical protein